MTRKRVLVGGGVRSGKSDFALHRAAELGARRAFVATAQAFDDEMRARIATHKAERDASFVTYEEPLELVSRIRALEGADVILVDCLTLWLSNLLVAELSDASIESRIEELVEAVDAARASIVLVTNEVGLGIVPERALARRFRDHAGRLHRGLADCADEVYFGAMGVMLRLRPAPVEAVLPWIR